MIEKMKDQLIKMFHKEQGRELSERDDIVQRLLDQNLISAREATILLKTVVIELNAENLELSSGAKIVGGSDFETNDFR